MSIRHAERNLHSTLTNYLIVFSGRLFDTAVAYKNEEAIGDAIAISEVPREEIVIVDKIHPKDFYTASATITSVEQSLEKLKVKIQVKERGS